MRRIDSLYKISFTLREDIKASARVLKYLQEVSEDVETEFNKSILWYCVSCVTVLTDREL